jgi:hypothetical protein
LSSVAVLADGIDPDNLAYRLGYAFGRLLMCLLLVGTVAWIMMRISRASARRSPQDSSDPPMPHPPQDPTTRGPQD